MKFGVCCGMDRAAIAAEIGFDYVELNFSSLTRADEDTYNSFLSLIREKNIKCEAANCFLPGEYKITGENIDYEKIEAYLKKGFERANVVGIKTVVMGSGGARNLPDGYSYKDGVKDIICLVKNYVAPQAAKYGIDFVFEPLCKAESNIINTIKEGAMLASAIDMPNVGTLGDIYHMHVEGDTYDDVRELKGILRHAHISNPVSDNPEYKRIYMKNYSEYDYKGFLDALEYAGCERVSIEASTDNFKEDATAAFKLLKTYK
ncbi:MAG: sugar phosphate isomerase/epimerase [Clostridia bacterium]|nr:sugar phosphate isomerase/epimerase [Clostridia bacterium]